MSITKPTVIVIGNYMVAEQPMSFCQWGVLTFDNEHMGECFHKKDAIKWAEELNKKEVITFQGRFAGKSKSLKQLFGK
jgi:hypothetical protein